MKRIQRKLLCGIATVGSGFSLLGIGCSGGACPGCLSCAGLALGVGLALLLSGKGGDAKETTSGDSAESSRG